MKAILAKVKEILENDADIIDKFGITPNVEKVKIRPISRIRFIKDSLYPFINISPFKRREDSGQIANNKEDTPHVLITIGIKSHDVDKVIMGNDNPGLLELEELVVNVLEKDANKRLGGLALHMSPDIEVEYIDNPLESEETEVKLYCTILVSYKVLKGVNPY